MNIFNTLEIEMPAMLSQWKDMMKRHRANNLFSQSDRLIARGGMTWGKFRSSMQGKTDKEKVRAVNELWNSRIYKTDKDNWHVADKWATPLEFAMKGGDCEDYAIAKMLTLQALGVTAPMRIIVSKHHAMLYIDMDGGMVLDNRTNTILSCPPEGFKLMASIETDKLFAHVEVV